MAALLVGLRLRQLGHSLTRSPWHIVSLVFGALGALGALSLLATGMVAMRALAPELAQDALVIIGAILAIGWLLGAVVVGVDDSLAPERFSLLPLTGRQLLPGLLVARLVGIGGVATAAALLLTLIGWSVSPAALVAAVVMLPVALLTCVLLANTLAALLARQLAGRRTRDVTIIVGVLLVACSGVVLQLAVGAIGSVGSVPGALAAIGDVLAWTPFGAAWGVPASLVAGDWGVAALRLVIALATVALLAWAWGRMLSARLTAPIASRGGGSVRSGAFIDRIVPATPVGAIAARALRLRFRDPRHIINMVMLVLLPLVLLGAQLSGGSLSGGFAAFAPAFAALMMITIVQMDVAYDNDAVAAHVVAGVSGRDDRAGRLLGIGMIAVPLVVIACVLCCTLSGSIALLPVSLGVSVGLTLIGSGVASWVGVYLPGRAPAPESNPLGRGSSGGIQSLAALAAIGPITIVVGSPVIATAIASAWIPWLAWVSLALGLVIGGVAIWVGIRFGGRALDRRWPELLAAVSSEG